MMRIIKITLLWVAGALILGHGIIPHHHHQRAEQQCAEAENNHKHSGVNLYDTGCCCDHETSGSEICHLDQRTLVKDYQNYLAYVLVETFKLNINEKGISASLNILRLTLIKDPFHDERPSRAPPKA